MKGYGLPRCAFWDYPDVYDIKAFGLKSSTGCPKEKGGDYRGYFKNKAVKKAIRRFWKGKARNEAKQYIRRQLSELAQA